LIRFSRATCAHPSVTLKERCTGAAKRAAEIVRA
jgi:hypothetical protein